MLRTRELVVVSPAHRVIGGLVRCGEGGKSTCSGVGNKLVRARRMLNFYQRSRRGCMRRYLKSTDFHKIWCVYLLVT